MAFSGVGTASVTKAGPVRSTIHQAVEITNGNFSYTISCDGEFIKIARKGTNRGFFLIPIAMWDEVVNFVYTENKRREREKEEQERGNK